MEPLKQTDDLFRRLLLQNDEHAVILLNASAQIIAWVGAAEKLFGYKAEEVLDKPFAMLFSPEDRAKQMPEYEMAVASKDGHAEDDRWMLRKDGRRFWATGTLLPIRSDTGEILAFGKILRNRTDIKGQLESTERQIERLQKTADSKNVFIATLAHELRTPLSSIATSLAILEIAGAQENDCRFARATIRRQLDHMKRMIEDLLEDAKADAGKIRLDRHEIPLNDIVAAAVEASRPAVDKHTHSLQLVMPDQPIIVNADASRLQQVFMNLIENAAKYTNYGGHIWIKVSVEGHEAVVRVEDTGIGISPEMMPRIFDLFTQAEIDSKGEGLGIGLSLVKDLTALHGGTVQVRSDGLGKGSEFTVRLPLAGIDKTRPDTPSPI